MEKFDIDYRKRKDGLMWIPVFTGMTITGIMTIYRHDKIKESAGYNLCGSLILIYPHFGKNRGP